MNNLPAEIAYILDEIADKDSNFYDTRKRIQQRDNQIHKFIKAHGSVTENPKEAAAYPKIKADFEKCMEIQDDKLDLAYIGLFIISRQVKKLNDEIKKLEDDGLLQPLPSGSNPANLLVSEKKEPASSTPKSRVSSVPGSGVANNTNSRSSPAPAATPAGSGRGSTPSFGSGMGRERPLKRSRGQSTGASEDHAHATQPPKNRPNIAAKNGDEDEVYCVCQRPSFGNMVACDNPGCQFEWFHYSCVGLKEPPTGTWYCPDCTKREKRKKL